MLPATMRDQFIVLLMDTGNVSKTARQLGINRMTAYGWREDQDFANRWDVALDAARDGLRERVVETACALGVGEWVPMLDPITGEPELDEDLEPVMRFETQNIDARVLMKLMDKTMRDEVRRVDQRTAVTSWAEHEVKVVCYSPDGEVIDAEFEDVDEGS